MWGTHRVITVHTVGQRSIVINIDERAMLSGSCPAGWAATINALVTSRVIQTDRIRSVMEQVNRQNYCQTARGCYDDCPQRIGWGITISAPHMHARALEELAPKLQPGARALDVGSGSGFLAVAMAKCVEPSGVTIGIDHVSDLVDWSRENVRRDGKQGLIDSGTLELHVRDGFKGYAEGGPYDAIHVGAAPEQIPPALLEQLKPSGVLLLPVGPTGGVQSFVKVTRDADPAVKKYHEERLFDVRYVPLTTVERQLRGS